MATEAHKLNADRVDSVIRDCLFRYGEDHSTAAVAEGVMRKFGFHPERLESHRADIAEMLGELPNEFRKSAGGGWSFLQACVDRDGRHWGEHPDMEALFALGLASGQAEYLLPREMWTALPGGMPYLAVSA